MLYSSSNHYHNVNPTIVLDFFVSENISCVWSLSKKFIDCYILLSSSLYSHGEPIRFNVIKLILVILSLDHISSDTNSIKHSFRFIYEEKKFPNIIGNAKRDIDRFLRIIHVYHFHLNVRFCRILEKQQYFIFLFRSLSNVTNGYTISRHFPNHQIFFFLKITKISYCCFHSIFFYFLINAFHYSCFFV